MSSRRLQENIAALALLQLFAYVAPLITVPYLVRVLQPAQFGLLSFAQGVVLYFDLITDYGFNLSSTRAIAAQRESPAAVSRIFWSTLWAKLILMLASAVALTILVAIVPKFRDEPGLYAANFLYVLGTAFFPLWLFQGLELLKIAAAALGIARLLTVPALFLFVHSEQDYVKAAAIQSSVQLVATVFVLPLFISKLRLNWYRPSLTDLRDTFRAGWPLFISGCALYVSTSSTTVILGFAAGRAEVGYYSAADKLIKAATAMLSPISQAVYPHLTALKAASQASALRLIRKTFFSVGALSLCVSLATLVLARPMCQLTLGPSFHQSIYVLQWLSPLPLFFGLMSVFGTQTMLVFEMDSPMCKIILAGAALGIPLTFSLSALFGAQGAAGAASLLAAFILICMIATLGLRGLTIWRRVTPEISECVR
jgi:PST family polysaccharide transporter